MRRKGEGEREERDSNTLDILKNSIKQKGKQRTSQQAFSLFCILLKLQWNVIKLSFSPRLKMSCR